MKRATRLILEQSKTIITLKPKYKIHQNVFRLNISQVMNINLDIESHN